MREAAGHLLGEQDFTSLTNAEAESKDYVKKVYSIDMKVDPDGIQHAESPHAYGGDPTDPTTVTILVRGQSFTYHMVRNIVGLLVDVGRAQIQAEDVPAILAAQDRQGSGCQGAPAHGLCLCRIEYAPPGEP